MIRIGTFASTLFTRYFIYRLLAFEGGLPSPCFSIMETPGGMGWTHSIASSLGASESGLRSVHHVYPGLLVNIYEYFFLGLFWANLQAIPSCCSTEDISLTKTLILNICFSFSQVKVDDMTC